MFGRASALLVVTVLALEAGCGSSSKPAAEPGSAAEVPSASAGSESSAPGAEAPSTGAAASPASEADAAAAPAEAAAPAPFAVCGQMCDRMGQRCSESATKACRLNCKQYQKLKPGCDGEARAALECARDAKDLQCAAIAPMSCNPAFLRFDACTKGEKLEEKAEGPKTPQGWERFSAKSPHFSVLMPRGVSETTEGGDPTFKVADGGVTYAVRVRKAPEGKATQKALVKVALDLLGVNCSKNLRLHGMIEHDQRVTIRFDSECKDGTEWRGQFVVDAGRLYVLALTGAKGFKAESDAFFSSFATS